MSRSDERGKRPVIVDIHGGGWNQDARMPATLRWFADHGYLVLRPSYELATPNRPTADTVRDQVFSAYAWCAKHAAEWGGDPQRLSVFGDSAGGGLAVSTAYRASVDARVPGPQDSFVPPDSVRTFAGQARSAGIDVTLQEVPWADHAFDAQFADSLGFQLVTSVTDAFLREA
ncbi:alpha/beta hydrolase [Corynebacterium uropygiale]|uniref:Alpha/beta hydrolase n=1 Tax=Corynebacterium uropygiale TaxID=1775911 RepID=A0A9X1U072_9CORY|nr:alpha/beta hydrolase [Corynebacterium uropygiale]